MNKHHKSSFRMSSQHLSGNALPFVCFNQMNMKTVHRHLGMHTFLSSFILSLFPQISKQTPYKTGWALTRVSSGSADHMCPISQLCLNSQYFTVYLWPNNPRSFTIDCIYIRIWWDLKTPGPPTNLHMSDVIQVKQKSQRTQHASNDRMNLMTSQKILKPAHNCLCMFLSDLMTPGKYVTTKCKGEIHQVTSLFIYLLLIF